MDVWSELKYIWLQKAFTVFFKYDFLSIMWAEEKKGGGGVVSLDCWVQLTKSADLDHIG